MYRVVYLHLFINSLFIPTLSIMTTCKMSKRTVVNEKYRGLVESLAIPAELHERDGKKYASVDSVVPIHCCSPEQIAEKANNTHHYCDVFSDKLLAPLGELAYVRLDENTAEKVFINRMKRLLLVSSDGRLAQWRCAPSFESTNQYIAGAPVVNKDGGIVSVLTAKRGNHYAVSNFEGEGGYFETSQPWKVLDTPESSLVYGDKAFSTREEMLKYVSGLPPALVGPDAPPTPVLHRGAAPRVALVASNGRQIAHYYLQGVAADVQYL